MKNSACIHLSRALTLFLLMFSSACQPAPAPASPTPFPTLPPIKPTSTDTILFSLLTATATSAATAQPTVTNTPAPLSSEGPWLVYSGQVHGDQGIVYYGQLIVNQDGTGKTQITPDCNPDNIQESPSNRLITFSDTIYLFDPAHLTWTLVYRTWPSCYSDYTGDNERGLLAVINSGIEEDIPELFIYELPGGKIRDRLPVLFKCPDEDKSCYTGYLDWWSFEMAWSPNGRYLTFSAVLENQTSDFGPSSDLYMYDTQTRKVLRLTSGPDSVAQIWWSPDGKWIIMGELHESSYPFTTSVWAVSASNNEMRKLYSLEDGYPQGILGWLDNRRFIVYNGTSLYDPLDLPAGNLNIVDIDTGELTSLFEGSFFSADLDKDDETVAVYVYITEPREGYEVQGIYLISTSNLKPRYMGSGEFQPEWDNKLKLFVTDEPCENDPKGKRAFDYKGEWQCIHSSLPDHYPSPDGKWQVSIQQGTWLEGDGKQPVQIFEGNAVQVIWRPDSAGFFLLADQNLYYVSLPQVTLTVIDRYMSENPIHYQWFEK
ncbi:MAG: hypothetical protein EHM40_11470 [Chloroflexi bacterium]|nr:MAG: hypothetical protein EHM40_11470 [Chloroflexota bacterium]